MILWRDICSLKLLAKANLILFFNKVSDMCFIFPPLILSGLSDGCPQENSGGRGKGQQVCFDVRRSSQRRRNSDEV